MSNARQNDARHRETLEMLPWYVSGQLDATEADAVREHVGHCLCCRREMLFLQDVQRASTEPVAVPEASPASLQRMLRRIDEAEDKRNRLPRRFGEAATALRRWLLAADPGVVWIFAVQTALILLLGSLALIQFSAAPEPAYRTLSSTESTRTQAAVRLVFAPETQVHEIMSSLGSIIPGASIVDGPSAIGVFTVALASSDALTPAQLAALRADPRVQFAEPLAGTAAEQERP